jgi:predicted RNase H-like HicB family nuclease
MDKIKRDAKAGLFAFSSYGGKTNMKFKVILEPEEDGGYSVHCPVLKGCHSQGQTVEEALANIKEAIEGCLVVLNEKTAPNLN